MATPSDHALHFPSDVLQAASHCPPLPLPPPSIRLLLSPSPSTPRPAHLNDDGDAPRHHDERQPVAPAVPIGAEAEVSLPELRGSERGSQN